MVRRKRPWVPEQNRALLTARGQVSCQGVLILAPPGQLEARQCYPQLLEAVRCVLD